MMMMIRLGLLPWLTSAVVLHAAAASSDNAGRQLRSNNCDELAPCGGGRRTLASQQPSVDATQVPTRSGIVYTCIDHYGAVRVINANQTCVAEKEHAAPLKAAFLSASPIINNGSTVTLTGENTVSSTGDGQPLEVMQPYLPLTHIISLEGIYPSRPSDDGHPADTVPGNNNMMHRQRSRRHRRLAGGGAIPFLGEIQIVAFDFAPKGWALCNGALLSIQDHTALFSLLGITYGGDGKTTFALPDLRGRAVLAPSFAFPQGATGGHQAVLVTEAQLPPHSHTINAVTGTLTLH